MGIVLGFLCLICLCFLLAKAIIRKLEWKKADNFLMKVHKYVCAAFIVICCCHIIFVFPVLKTRHLAVCISGIATALLLLLIVSLYHKVRINQKRMLHWHRFLSVFIFIGIIAHIAFYYIDFGAYQNRISNIQLEEINTNSLDDGQYIGEYDAGYIYAKVSVTISQGYIERIDILEHRNERGKLAEQVTENITDMQKFPVDAISGATNSSKVIQQAIQNALKGESINEYLHYILLFTAPFQY